MPVARRQLLPACVQDNDKLLSLLREAETLAPHAVIPASGGGMHWKMGLEAGTAGARRPVSADAMRLPSNARSAEPGTKPEEGFTSALLDAARTALNRERTMRHQASGV